MYYRLLGEKIRFILQGLGFFKFNIWQTGIIIATFA